MTIHVLGLELGFVVKILFRDQYAEVDKLSLWYVASTYVSLVKANSKVRFRK